MPPYTKINFVVKAFAYGWLMIDQHCVFIAHK